jgi:putative membrane protein
MNKFILRWIINIAGLYLAVLLVPGVQLRNEDFLAFVWLALILGLLNALVRPILKLLTCPLIILTLGLGTLVLNTAMLYILQWAAGLFEISFVLTDFWQAFLGALVVSIVSVILTMVLRDEIRGRGPRRRK